MRTDGARAFASEVNADAEAVQRLGRNTEAAGRSMSRSAGRMRSMSSVSSAMGRNLQTVQRGMTGVGVAIGGMGTLALKTGIQFNATMESQTTAFTGFLGSTAKAKAYLNDLYKIAAKTPFEFEDVVAGTRNLMAFGMSAKESKGMISDLGNAIAATGASGEAVKHATFALGQIQAAGTLHGGDLNQLVQAGVVSVPKLAKAMGKSNEGFRKDMSKNKITSEDFFKSMRKQWSEDPMYKGAAAKQAKTFMGQLSTLHDYVTQTLGTITKPLFDALSKNVLPSVTKLTQDIARIWKRTDISVEDKLGLTKSAIDAKLQPLVDAFKNWWTKNNVTERLQQQFYSAMGALTRAAEASAPKVAEAFLNAWLRAPTWAKVASGAWLLRRLGLGGPIAALLGKGLKGLKGLGGKGKGGLGGVAGKAGAVPVWVMNPGFGGPGGKPGKVTRAAKTAAKLAPWASRAAPAASAGVAAGSVAALAWYYRNKAPLKEGRDAGRNNRYSGHVPFVPGPMKRSMATGVYRPPGTTANGYGAGTRNWYPGNVGAAYGGGRAPGAGTRGWHAGNVGAAYGGTSAKAATSAAKRVDGAASRVSRVPGQVKQATKTNVDAAANSAAQKAGAAAIKWADTRPIEISVNLDGREISKTVQERGKKDKARR